jgi:hypothetical protein
MKTDTSIDHFDTMTEFLTREAKGHVLDSLACVFHNEGYSLEGNTEHNDTRWLADLISRTIEDRGLDRCSEDRQRELMKIAQVAKDCLPALADRMASRYITVSKAIRTTERIARQQGK